MQEDYTEEGDDESTTFVGSRSRGGGKPVLPKKIVYRTKIAEGGTKRNSGSFWRQQGTKRFTCTEPFVNKYLIPSTATEAAERQVEPPKRGGAYVEHFDDPFKRSTQGQLQPAALSKAYTGELSTGRQQMNRPFNKDYKNYTPQAW
jgi:hypothetical protein